MFGAPVRAASVGLGRWAKVITEGVGQASGLEITGCFTGNEERRAVFAGEHNCQPYPSYEAILADGDIEAVLLTTPHSAHHTQILASARAGKHVFVEKPMTLTVEQGREALTECAKAGVTLMVGHCWRRLGPVRRLKALIEGGELGTLLQTLGHFGNPRALDFGQESWRDQRRESPTGPFTGPGFHLLDVLHYLMGPVDSVCAASQRLFSQGPADDTAVAMLQFASGALGQVSSSFVTPNRYWLSIYGSEANAFVLLDPSGASLNPSGLKLQRRGTASAEPVQIPEGNMVAEQMAEFAQCVRAGSRPQTDGVEGLALVATLEALESSAESSSWKSVATIP
jgi:predicted dehydrogenase